MWVPVCDQCGAAAELKYKGKDEVEYLDFQCAVNMCLLDGILFVAHTRAGVRSLNQICLALIVALMPESGVCFKLQLLKGDRLANTRAPSGCDNSAGTARLCSLCEAPCCLHDEYVRQVLQKMEELHF